MAQITITEYRNALFALGVAQKAATPQLLRDVKRWRPGGMQGEKPVYWVGGMAEEQTHDMQHRFRTIRAEVVIATTYPSDELTNADPFDQLTDALVERFTDDYHAVHPNTVMEIVAVADGEESFEGSSGTVGIYRARTITVRLRIWEGRQ